MNQDIIDYNEWLEATSIKVEFNSAAQSDTQPLLDAIRALPGVESAKYPYTVADKNADLQLSNPEAHDLLSPKQEALFAKNGHTELIGYRLVPSDYDRISVTAESPEKVPDLIKQINDIPGVRNVYTGLDFH